MPSIYHFWQDLLQKRGEFLHTSRLEDFPFSGELLSCRNSGIFPDMAIRLDVGNDLFPGGELLELKDSASYTVSSFNSTIPGGKKNIRDIAPSEASTTYQQMRLVGDDVYAMEIRPVYYLLRGRRKNAQKICLVHGSFFQTIPTEQLIRQFFAQVLEENSATAALTENEKKTLLDALSQQEMFSKVRHVPNASVKLRFRVMTEVTPEGNLLNPKQYPQLGDNTLNFLVPYHTETEKEQIYQRMNAVCGSSLHQESFSLKHPLNGWFLLFQAHL